MPQTADFLILRNSSSLVASVPCSDPERPQHIAFSGHKLAPVYVACDILMHFQGYDDRFLFF